MSTDKIKRQWVDLGIKAEACMTQPETCGAVGGAISVWLTVIDCSHDGGIIATEQEKGRMGASVYCGQGNLT